MLSEEIASQIAAGEVVERPASAVKELVENALDSGAATIMIEVEGAGKRLIRVADDGAGIPSGEMTLAVARYSTSKLAFASDLFRITTLGFRGEALASIASVSRLTLVSRARGDEVGARLVVDGGAISGGPRAEGGPPGTVAMVENLFFNVPARLKFLKSETTERRQIDALVSRYALAYPDVRFRLTHDGRETFRSSGSGDRREALASVFGVEVARQLLAVGEQPDRSGDSPAPDAGGGVSRQVRKATEIATTGQNIQISGYVSPPALTRSSRREMTFLVNGRWVQDQRLNAAVLQAYHTLLMAGQYPIAVIFLEVPPEAVDVNVHPAKAEIRFRDPDAAFTAVQRAVRMTLLEKSPAQEVRLFPSWSSGGWTERREQLIGPDWRMGSAFPNRLAVQPGTRPQTADTLPAMEPGDIPLLRVVGQIGAVYIVAEGPDGLYLIDQHAAHERVLYEQYVAERKGTTLTSQSLLEPATVTLPPEQARLLEDQLGAVRHLGFEVDPFGGATFRVHAIPALLGALDPALVLQALVGDFEEDERPLEAETEAKLIARVCKRAAVKAGQVLSLQEQQALVHKLETCESPRTCPHGRPTMIHLTIDTLARQFGRK